MPMHETCDARGVCTACDSGYGRDGDECKKCQVGGRVGRRAGGGGCAWAAGGAGGRSAAVLGPATAARDQPPPAHCAPHR